MAKEPEKKAEELEEVAEDIESPKKEKGAKTKPAKSADKGQLPLLLMIGGALGGVIMIIVSVVIGTVIAQKLFPPQMGAPVETEEHAEAEGEHGHAVEKLAPVPDGEDMSEEGAPSNLLADAGTLTFKSGKLASNTKGSANTVCLLEFVAEYKPYYVEQLTAKGFLTEAGVDAHGNPAPPGVDTTNELYQKLKLSVASEMMLFFNSKTSTEIHNMQSIGVLSDTLKNVLKKPFKETGLQIGRVSISGFNIAGT